SEERRAIVRRHLIENGGDLAFAETFYDILLYFGFKVFEDRSRFFAWKKAENDRPIIFRQLVDYIGDLALVDVRQLAADLVPTAISDLFQHRRTSSKAQVLTK